MNNYLFFLFQMLCLYLRCDFKSYAVKSFCKVLLQEVVPNNVFIDGRGSKSRK